MRAGEGSPKRENARHMTQPMRKEIPSNLFSRVDSHKQQQIKINRQPVEQSRKSALLSLAGVGDDARV